MYRRLESWKRSKSPMRRKLEVGQRPPRHLLEAVKWRESKNKVSLFIITGKRGTGKSNNAIVYAKIFDPTFTIKERLFFHLDDLLAFMKETGISKKPIWVVLDEAGYNLDSYKWQDKLALVFKYLTEMGRVSKVNIILTLPVFTGLNKATRRLGDFLMVCFRQGFGRIYILSVDSFDGTQKRFTWLDADVTPVDDKTWREYEDRHEEFWKGLVNKSFDKKKLDNICPKCKEVRLTSNRRSKTLDCGHCDYRIDILITKRNKPMLFCRACKGKNIAYNKRDDIHYCKKCGYSWIEMTLIQWEQRIISNI